MTAPFPTFNLVVDIMSYFVSSWEKMQTEINRWGVDYCEKKWTLKKNNSGRSSSSILLLVGGLHSADCPLLEHRGFPTGRHVSHGSHLVFFCWSMYSLGHKICAAWMRSSSTWSIVCLCYLSWQNWPSLVDTWTEEYKWCRCDFYRGCKSRRWYDSIVRLCCKKI